MERTRDLLHGVAVRALVVRDGRILLVQRSGDSRHESDCWELPGGKVEVGETAQDALVREVAEETGIQVEVGRPFGVWNAAVEPYWVTVIAFECSAVEGDVSLSFEHASARWSTLDEALAMPLSQSTRKQIKSYRSLHSKESGSVSHDDAS